MCVWNIEYIHLKLMYIWSVERVIMYNVYLFFLKDTDKPGQAEKNTVFTVSIWTEAWANSVEQDQMPQNGVFDQGLPC